MQSTENMQIFFISMLCVWLLVYNKEVLKLRIRAPKGADMLTYSLFAKKEHKTVGLWHTHPVLFPTRGDPVYDATDTNKRCQDSWSC